ncbi:hypothetical protein D3C72_870780 [compost metagenome]
MEDVFGGNRLAADTAFGERDVFGNARVQVVADHQHVEVFIDGVAGERPGRVGRTRQHVGKAAGLDDVRRVTATGTFGVIGVNGAALERAEGGFDETGLVEGVGVDRHLHVELIGDAQAVVDARRRGAPVFVQLEPDGAGLDLLDQRLRQAGVAFAGEANVHRERVSGLKHARQVPRAGGASGGVGASGWAGAAADHGGDAAHQRFFDLLRADEMDVCVDATSGEDHAFAGDYFGACANGDGHVGLHVGVAGLADCGDAPVLEADVGFDDAPVVDDQRVGDQRVDHFGSQQLALALAVADDFAATEFHFFAVGGEVVFDFDPQLGVGQAHLVADGGAEHVGVGLSGDFHVSALVDRSHALRGNAAMDALRPPLCDAERHGMHSHAERGNDQSVEVAHDPSGKSEHPPMPGVIDQLNLTALPRLKAHRRARRNIQAHATAGGAIEGQRVVGFKKVIVRTDLNWPVAAVGDFQADSAAADVEFDVAGLDLVLARNHHWAPCRIL